MSCPFFFYGNCISSENCPIRKQEIEELISKFLEEQEKQHIKVIDIIQQYPHDSAIFYELNELFDKDKTKWERRLKK